MAQELGYTFSTSVLVVWGLSLGKSFCTSVEVGGVSGSVTIAWETKK